LPSTGSSSSLLSLLEFALELGTVLTRPLLDLVWPGARGGRVLLLLENRLCQDKEKSFVKKMKKKLKKMKLSSRLR